MAPGPAAAEVGGRGAHEAPRRTSGKEVVMLTVSLRRTAAEAGEDAAVLGSWPWPGADSHEKENS